MDTDGIISVSPASRQNSAITDIANGSVAGALGKVIEYPFDTVKVRLQTQGKNLFPNTWSCIKYTYNNEGVAKGFFQGITSPLVGAAFENAVLFVGYNQCLQYLQSGQTNKNQSSIYETLVSGAFAGSCASFILTPVELIKCKLQVTNINNAKHQLHKSTKILPTIKQVLNERGVVGLWQGQSGTFIRETFGGVVWFSTYEILKTSFINTHTIDNTSQPQNKTWELLASGACAGIAFNASIFPVDTVKSVMQIDQLSLTKSISHVFKSHGLRGFYRGLGITLIRAIPANAAVFYTYETLSDL